MEGKAPRASKGSNPGHYQGTTSPSMEPLLTPRDVAKLLRVSERTVRRLVDERSLPCVRFGRSVRFLPSDVFRWLRVRREV